MKYFLAPRNSIVSERSNFKRIDCPLKQGNIPLHSLLEIGMHDFCTDRVSRLTFLNEFRSRDIAVPSVTLSPGQNRLFSCAFGYPEL
ncbi:hypothetical protein SUGI_0206910 [Cryptomeria japonica]|nr:hypothetical protein SUGI_0206910 [Cryptomeria japonica]